MNRFRFDDDDAEASAPPTMRSPESTLPPPSERAVHVTFDDDLEPDTLRYDRFESYAPFEP